MIYRAKCKKCDDVIETDEEEKFCGCGEISIGGKSDPLRCSARDFTNFIRLDDEMNEITVQVKANTPSRDNLILCIHDMIDEIERLPGIAKTQPVTQFDMLSLCYWLSAWISSDD